jgi:UDP-N-acetyl-D-mannosaminuronate dehydrogenase
VKSADALLLMVSHSIFRQLNPFELAASTSARIVIDTVNAWNSKSWQDAGFRVLRLGGNKPSIQ